MHFLELRYHILEACLLDCRVTEREVGEGHGKCLGLIILVASPEVKLVRIVLLFDVVKTLLHTVHQLADAIIMNVVLVEAHTLQIDAAPEVGQVIGECLHRIACQFVLTEVNMHNLYSLILEQVNELDKVLITDATIAHSQPL